MPELDHQVDPFAVAKLSRCILPDEINLLKVVQTIADNLGQRALDCLIVMILVLNFWCIELTLPSPPLPFPLCPMSPWLLARPC